MEYKLHHFALLCEDFEKSLAFYRDIMGNQVASRWQNQGFLNVAFVGKGGDGMIELIGKPFLEHETRHIADHGYTINHMSFLVEDADAAFEELKGKGVNVAWEPQTFLNLRQCGFHDVDGLLFEVFSYPSDMPLATPEVSKQAGPTDVMLHHISILSPDLRRSQRFYEQMLGFQTVYEYLEHDGGFIFLIDPGYEHESNSLMLEIIGPPDLEAREEVMLEKHGACYDHFAYTAPDVDGAWKILLERGAKNMAAPVKGYGVQMAWVNDQDGVDVELMSPIPDEIITKVLHGGEPFDAMQI